MRDEADRVGLAARLDRDDVGDPCGQPEFRPHRVGFLHADVESVEPQLIDEVGPRLRIVRGARRPAANRARQHIHVRPRVLHAEPHIGLTSARAGQQREREDEYGTRDSASRQSDVTHAESLPHNVIPAEGGHRGRGLGG